MLLMIQHCSDCWALVKGGYVDRWPQSVKSKLEQDTAVHEQ